MEELKIVQNQYRIHSILNNILFSQYHNVGLRINFSEYFKYLTPIPDEFYFVLRTQLANETL